jgi:dihydrodipicolinate reductase
MGLGAGIVARQVLTGHRRTGARGALRAAAWLIDRPPGLYGLDDLLDAD